MATVNFGEPVLQTSVEFLKGIGAFKATLLTKELGIANYNDLLHHFPYRYLDTTEVQQIGALTPDKEWVQLRGIIMNFQEHGTGFKKRLTATLYDQTGQLELVWFQGINFILKQIKPNTPYSVFGKLSFFNGFPTVTHPELEPLQGNAEKKAETMQPLYSVTEKLRSKGINNRSFAKITQALFEKIAEKDIYEILPEYLLRRHQLMGRYAALQQVHFPVSQAALEAARTRLKWEELFIAQLKIQQAGLRKQGQLGFAFHHVGNYFNTFYKDHLPFPLTNAQKRVVKEIRTDTLSGKQMNRLVQGDVGSGKTTVALLSMPLALDNGY